jgi:hypothetical protein
MSKDKNILELVALAEKRKGEYQERQRLEKLKAQHQRTMANIGDDDIEDPAVQKKVAEATLGLTLVAARLNRMNVPHREFDAINSLLNKEKESFNQVVLAAKARAFAELLASQERFFDGDKAACREWWERLFPPHPMFRKFADHIATQFFGPREQRDIVQEVDSFLKDREKANAELKLGLD